jgi:hypothetical protein
MESADKIVDSVDFLPEHFDRILQLRNAHVKELVLVNHSLLLRNGGFELLDLLDFLVELLVKSVQI